MADTKAAKELAKKIGYPVILKAAAGGGGRGMRVVEKEADLEKAFWSAESEFMSDSPFPPSATSALPMSATLTGAILTKSGRLVRGR